MKEEKGRGKEDMARKSFETFDGKIVINSTFFALFPQPPISYYPSLSLSSGSLCRKEFTLQRMQGLVKSGISGIIYIYIYTLHSRLKLELRSEERNSVAWKIEGRIFGTRRIEQKDGSFASLLVLRSFSWR